MRPPQLQCKRCDSGRLFGRERRRQFHAATIPSVIPIPIYVLRFDGAAAAGGEGGGGGAVVAMIVIRHGRQRDDDIVGKDDYFHETRILGEMQNDSGMSELGEV